MALRARALLVGTPPQWLVDVCGAAIGHSFVGGDLALYSRSGSRLSKAMYFLFSATDAKPVALVIAMSDPGQARRLRTEFERVAAFRSWLSGEPELLEALPLEPLHAGEVEGEYLVIVPPDPFASATGNPDRDASLSWLRRFQAVTSTDTRPWDEDDVRRESEFIERASAIGDQLAEPESTRAMHGKLAELVGRPVPRCAVHGDFWHGNMAALDGRLRIYDWEWAEFEGTPFLDLWTYELGELLAPPRPPETLVAMLLRSVRELESELSRRDLDSRFALASLGPSVARLSIRMRLATGIPGPAEAALASIRSAAAHLLDRSP